MAFSTPSYELDTVSEDATPLLYHGIIDNEAPTTPSVPVHNSSVVIEAAPSKVTSDAPTKWIMKNGFWHCSDSSIADEWGHAAYEVKASGFWLLGMEFVDVHSGAAVAQLKQRFSLMPTFELYRKGQEEKQCTIKMKFTIRGFKMIASFDNGEPDMIVHGNHFATRYHVNRGEVVLASVVRKWCRHKYEVAAGEDQVLIHSLIAAADKALTLTRRKGVHACSSH